MKSVIVDVRERDEFNAESIEDSVCMPLSHFGEIAPGMLNQMEGSEIVLMCRSGNRAKLAADQIAQFGFGDRVKTRVYPGGILAWKKEGKATVKKRKTVLPIMRQVQIGAGGGVLIFTALGFWMNPAFLLGTAFFGAGLTFAGVSGFCGMAHLLAVMPWNKNKDINEGACQS